MNQFSMIYDTKNAEKVKMITIESYDDYFFTITYYIMDEPQAIRFASGLKRIALDGLAAKASG